MGRRPGIGCEDVGWELKVFLLSCRCSPGCLCLPTYLPTYLSAAAIRCVSWGLNNTCPPQFLGMKIREMR